MKRIARTFLYILLTAVLLLGGCGKEGRQEEQISEQESRKIQIGLSFDSFVIERWMRDRDVFVSTAHSLGAEVNVQNANGSVEEQISQIEYFIKKKMDAIVIIAIDGEALTDVVKKAKDEGIKVISYDRLIMNAGTDLYISFDNEKVGRLMGEALKNALPEGGDIFAICGSQSDHNTQLVQQGLDKALEDSGLQIVYSAYCDNWLAELAFDAVNQGLDEYDGGFDGKQEIKGIMCGNDDLASQAIKALSEHRLAGKVAVVAQDADLSACQRIVEGTQEMTTYKPVDELAQTAAALSVALAKGEDITDKGAKLQVTDTMDDGSGEIPYYSIDPVAVTAENMDKVIIESGFHLREDVYLNVK